MSAPSLYSDTSALVSHIARRVPRITLNVTEACEALGVSWDFWSEHVAPDVRIIRRGRKKLVAVAELERWAAAAGEWTL